MDYKKLKYYILVIPGIVLIIYISYGDVLNFEFVYDDIKLIVENPFIKNLGNLKYLFPETYFSISKKIYYRPLVTLSQYLDYSLWQGNPWGFHLTNLILHALNSLLVVYIGIRILNERITASFAGLLFAAHPAFTESVTCISMRDDPLSFIFFAIAFLGYARFRKKGELSWYVLSILCFIFALLSKLMAASLPIILLFYESMV